MRVRSHSKKSVEFPAWNHPSTVKAIIASEGALEETASPPIHLQKSRHSDVVTCTGCRRTAFVNVRSHLLDDTPGDAEVKVSHGFPAGSLVLGKRFPNHGFTRAYVLHR